jgi:hypothetical protein
MALVTKASDINFDAASAMYCPQISGRTAGEALAAFAPCYIKSSDGKIYECNATSFNEAAEVAGFAPRAYASGDTNVTLYGAGLKIRYATGLTPGDILYLAATAGRLDTAPTVGDPIGVALVIAANLIVVTRAAPVKALTASSLAMFVSTEQTGTGSSQNVAHGLGVVPSKVLIAPTEHPGTPDTGAFDIAEGSHTSTNVVVTVTVNVKFKVLALA